MSARKSISKSFETANDEIAVAAHYAPCASKCAQQFRPMPAGAAGPSDA
ncbi:hypothetical protein [Achromobacter aegrifaciens]